VSLSYRTLRHVVDYLSASQACNLVAFNIKKGELYVSFSICLKRLWLLRHYVLLLRTHVGEGNCGARWGAALAGETG
jgi:hypothetical protein